MNVVAERALRPAVLWRKGCFGFGSEAGSRFAEQTLTMVTSCRHQGRRLLDFLVVAGIDGARPGDRRRPALTGGGVTPQTAPGSAWKVFGKTEQTCGHVGQL